MNFYVHWQLIWNYPSSDHRKPLQVSLHRRQPNVVFEYVYYRHTGKYTVLEDSEYQTLMTSEPIVNSPKGSGKFIQKSHYEKLVAQNLSHCPLVPDFFVQEQEISQQKVKPVVTGSSKISQQTKVPQASNVKQNSKLIFSKPMKIALLKLNNHISELKKHGEVLENEYKKFPKSKDYLKSQSIKALADQLKTYVDDFSKTLTGKDRNVFMREFKEHLDENINTMQEHRHEFLHALVILGNIALAIVIIPHLANAIYVVSEGKEELSFRSVFFGMKTAAEEKCLEITSDFNEFNETYSPQIISS